MMKSILASCSICLRAAFVALFASGFLSFCLWPGAEAHEPDPSLYIVPFPQSPPIDGAGAVATIPERSITVLNYLACGDEATFYASASTAGNDSDGFLTQVIAKIKWLQQHNGCVANFPIRDADINSYANADTTTLPTQDLGQVMATKWPDCRGSNTTILLSPNPGNNPSTTNVIATLSRACLVAQVNDVLIQIQEGDRYPGTNPLPCYIGGSQKGDWDVVMKMLIRILFLDNETDTPVLSQAVHDHIQHDLITVDGGPGQDSYSWLACGDHEKSTGMPSDREDNNSAVQDEIDAVGDFFSWLFKRLVLIVVFMSAAGLVAPLVADSPLAALGAAVVVVGISGILVGQIPETENHRLMIESTRYLNNQLIIEQLGENAPGIKQDQVHVTSWLLSRFRTILENDFNEYNSRPYQGYSLTALQNLADFAGDPNIRTGALLLLNYSAAKFAIGSSQGRRLVPFRRRLNDVECILGTTCLPNDEDMPEGPITLFQLFEQDDHQIALGLLFNGQTQQLKDRFISKTGVSSMGISATTHYFQDPLIADLAINKDKPYLQRIHHAGYEIYSSSPNALITAGGIKTGHADPFTIGPVSLSVPSWAENGDLWQDVGAGIPTSVMITGGSQVVTATQPLQLSKIQGSDFILFEGTLSTYVPHYQSFQDNLCVWRNFACGTNISIPGDLNSCFNNNQVGSNWLFIDSKLCPGYDQGLQRFFLILFIVCDVPFTCNKSVLSAGSSSIVNAGFLEVHDATLSESFDQFKANVVQSNPSSSLGSLGSLGCLTASGTCEGLYHSASNHTLSLYLRGHQDHSDGTGINNIDGAKFVDNGVSLEHIGDWTLAQGDVINSTGDGFISIKNARLNAELDLDFRDVTQPCLRTGPTQLCIQH